VIIAITAAALINISITATEITLATGVVLLIVWRRFAFPRIWIPLVLFFLWTGLADIVSPDPLSGWAYMKKAFDFLFIPLMYSAFVNQLEKVNNLVTAWTATASASGLWGLAQYGMKYEQAQRTGADFYVTYLARRITGFQGHWMMFGALQLGALTLVLAHYFFSDRKLPKWAYCSVAIFLTAILLSWDRSIWLAAVPVLIYLIVSWRPKLVLLLPLAAVLTFAVSPPSTRARIESLARPHGDTDSNRFRIVTLRTGIEMIRTHPWFGLGPDEVRREFKAYVPADIKRPLPTGYYGHLHNFYIEYAAERGIPALFFILLFIAWTGWDCAQGILRLGKVKSVRLFVLHATMGIFIGILVGGLFEHNLGDSEVLMMFTCVIGIGYAAIRNPSVGNIATPVLSGSLNSSHISM